MQAAKRYGLVAILSILLILGYLYRPGSDVSVGGQFSHSATDTFSSGPQRGASPGGQSSLGSLLQTSPPKEEKTKTEDTNLRIPTDKHSNSQKEQPSNTKPSPAVNQNEKEQNDQTHPVGDVHDISTVEHDTLAGEQSLKDGSDQTVTEVVPHLKQEVSEVVPPLKQEVTEVVPHLKQEVTEVVPHLKQLMTESGLRLSELDELYNISRAAGVDLHNVTFLDNYYRYNYQVIEDRLLNRMKNVRSVCEQVHFKRSTQYNLYQFNELGLTWCPVFKSGSTTWRNYFIEKFVRNPPKEYNLNLLKPRQLVGSRKTRLEHMKQYFREEDERNIRFTMVRHPFSRLVSHMKSSGRDHEMVIQRGMWIESSIVAGRTHLTANNADLFRYRSELSSYFVWLKSGKPGEVFKDGSPENPFLNPPYPKLSELVNHIIKMRKTGRDWDGHWMPASEFCNICTNKFQYIIRLEDEPLELWYLVDKLGLWKDRTLFLNRANNSTKKETDMDEVWGEINKLKKEHVDFLSRHFDVDFKMFGYRRGHRQG